MSKERIKELLGQLREELQTTDIDDELERLLGDLDDDIDRVIDDDGDLSEVIDRAKKVEANFATTYPTAERFVRELIDLLVRMGI
jgi:ABC-type transporter Mla subunit MlaD